MRVKIISVRVLENLKVSNVELKTLWLGLLISTLAFSVKTGLGWSYLWLKCPKGKRFPVTFSLILLYFVLFAGVYLLVNKVNILAHYEFLAPLWQSGVTLHWLVASLLFLWGLILLRTDNSSCACAESPTRGWLALVIPCPVCLSVILMSLAGLVMYFPENALLASSLLYLAFLGVASGAGFLMILSSHPKTEPLERSLGLIMILIAAYFMLTALVMPQFSSVQRIYRLASYSHENQIEFGFKTFLIFGSILLLGVGGFIYGIRNSRKLAKGHHF
ncbi:MAG: DUF2162 domain-containing protein [Deltaproteobacteria bacterium]|nr:DUF2162 domain-containing protein [Deltaproteobacteria bacterium]